jgi:N-acetylglucosaminyldiphosphoundecaprenol N-acetyl-beta-D-mannosaminyltransferase
VLNDQTTGSLPARAAHDIAQRDARANPHWTARWQSLFSRIHWCRSDSDRDSLTVDLLRSGASRSRIVAFVNAHAMNIAAERREFAQDLLASDILLRDGIGLAILARLSGSAPGLNMNGTDYIPELLRRFDGRRIALLGTAKDAAETAGARVRREHAPASELRAGRGLCQRHA